jgi:phosphatidylglycerophosphate synthase
MNQKEVISLLFTDRTRTNLLHTYEQAALAYLVKRVPEWIKPDMLTALGFAGSLLIFMGFLLASYSVTEFLLIGVFGYMVSWFGDSLDGRLAYFRKIPRKWYGFSLDIIVDWLGIIVMGAGFIVYVDGNAEFIGFLFVVFYGWQMLLATLRYKVTGTYKIDSGVVGPTEVRIIISLIFIAEVLSNGLLVYASMGLTVILFIFNLKETKMLLIQATQCDDAEKKEINRRDKN